MKTVCVGLLWHSLDSANLGVGALTHGQIHLVARAAAAVGVEPRFVIIGWAREDSARPDPRVIEVCQVNAARLLGLDQAMRRALARCDLVLDIGEGDSFSDIYGWKRLAYLIGTKLLAARDGRPLVLSPQTLGPFDSPVAAWLADLAMRRSKLVCTRDGLSTTYFESRRLSTAFLEATDVAFALPFERAAAQSALIRVGLNVSGLLWAGGYSGRNQFGLALDYRQTMRELAARLAAQPNVRLVLVPHVVTPDRLAEDDLRACQALASEFGGELEMAGMFDTPMSAKSFISGLDFFVGARMHACIAAFSSGVPCVPMAYSRKFTGLFGSLGYLHVADCRSDSQTAVVALVLDAFGRRAELAAEAITGQTLAEQRLGSYVTALEGLLRDVRHG